MTRIIMLLLVVGRYAAEVHAHHVRSRGTRWLLVVELLHRFQVSASQIENFLLFSFFMKRFYGR